MIQWGVEWLLRVNYRTWVHHSDWLVWRQRSLEAELALGNFLLFFLWWSTGAVWLHFPSEQHCHRNVTHPCCCVRVRLVRVTLCARHSLLNCKTSMQHGVSAELLSSGSVWYVHVCDCWLAFLQERTRTSSRLITKKVSPETLQRCYIWYL